MYEDLINKLRELPHLLFVQLGEHEDVVYQAADAIEVLDMKLQGANAAIAGMQREIERMVIDSVNSKPKWIPVTERLPKYGTKVLVFAYGHDTLTARMQKRTENGYPVFECNGTYLELAKQGRITHWMPLPEPPKDGE